MRIYTLIYLSILTLSISCKNNKKENKVYSNQDYQELAATIMAQPKFYGEDIVKKITGTDFILKTYYTDTKQLYVYIEKQKFEENIDNFIISRDSINIGQISGNAIWLGNHFISDSNLVLFKTNTRNLKVDKNQPIQIKYKTATYKTNLKDIMSFLNMNNLIRGGIYAQDINHVLINHGSAVAKKDIKSLKDFATELTEKGKTKEEKAQILLDFITTEIEYNFDEAYAELETIKRPSEILFTKNSDCSGKSILYASLLQQLDIDWCLAYYKNHLAVGLAGNFNPKNAIKFKFKGNEYFVAETTAPLSKIGEDKYKSKLNSQFIEYVHNPNKDKNIYNYRTKKSLEFVKVRIAN